VTIEAGMLVTPSVRLVTPLSAGGMAAVWVADHLTLHTRVVVKFMSTELASNEEARARFSREAAASAAVKSPHVVQVFDHGIIDGAPFIVMELLEGEDLRVRLARGVVPLVEVEAIISHVCKALGQAHRAGVVHRDIKPDNIFLCRNEDGEVFAKLLDFGIAKQEDSTGAMSATRTGSVMGTPYYMSPEQVIGLKNIDFRTDLWSLGVVAFEAMTGMKAFNGETLGALAVAITHGPMPIPSRCNRMLPYAVDDWFARACAREVAHRFASAKEMAAVFRVASTGAPATGSMPRLSVTAPLGHVHAVSAAPALMSTTTSPMHGSAPELAPPPPMSKGPLLALGIVGAGALVLLIAVVTMVALKTMHVGEHDVVATAAPSPSPPTPPPPVTMTTTAPEPPPPPPGIVTATATAPTHVVPQTHVNAKPDAGKVTTTNKPDCTVPYYFDGAGNKVFRKECLQ
jgi:serine/threonine protein kinase